MKTLISFNGKTPSELEREQLLACSLDKQPFLSVEHNRKIIEGFLFFLSGFVALPFSLFLFFSKITFQYYYTGRAFPVVLFGFSLFLLFQGIRSFYSFYKISKDSHSREPQQVQVMHKYVKCLLDTHYFRVGTIDVGNFYATLQNMLPESQKVVDYQTFADYLTGFHSKMLVIVKDEAKSLNIVGESFNVSSVDALVTSKKTVFQGVEKLTMKVNLSIDSARLVRSMWRDKLVPVRVLCIQLVFSMTLIQVGKRWFVYDPLPDYKIEQSSDVLQ